MIQNLTEYDLEFIEWSTAMDNPAVREKIQNTVYDDDFDAWYEKEMREKKPFTEDTKDTTQDNDDTDDSDYNKLESVKPKENIEDWEEVK